MRKTAEEMQKILDGIVNGKYADRLTHVLITWRETERNIELAFVPMYLHGMPMHNPPSSHVVATFPKWQGRTDCTYEGIRECTAFGKSIYFNFRRLYPLKRSLGGKHGK